jgi:2-polyprenyl-6-methoxyphenol hydroxylase-like FAD-dependent oxidoreductase
VDVVIVGGGVAGSATALALAAVGVRARIVEGGVVAGAARPRVGESLAPPARSLLEQLGIWPSFARQGHAPCVGSASSWGADALGYNDTIVHPAGQGWHLDRAAFDAWILRLAGEQVEVVRDRVTSVRREGAGFRVVCDNTTLDAAFVVDATGRQATVARALGASPLANDQLVYLACTFATEGPFPLLTLLEAVEEGWWYAARLPDDSVTVAIASDPELVRALGLHRAEGWDCALARTHHVGATLGAATRRDEPRAWVVTSGLSAPPAGDGWLAVGDAASTYDPLSAAGIEKALGDALAAAVAIRAWQDGDVSGVATYARRVILGFRAYLEQRDRYYCQERRWADAPFWVRRRERRNLRR